MVCRGCCCGRKKKRPGVDHKGQLARLSELRDHEGRDVPVRVSKCLGICFKANVVVVQPSSTGRAAGGRPVWLGDFTEEKLIGELDDWVFEGGPGIAPLPELLEPHITSKDAKKPKKAKKEKKIKAAKKAKQEKAEPGVASGKDKDEKPKKGKVAAKAAKKAGQKSKKAKAAAKAAKKLAAKK
ncbi:(2Fe-2S) ferredoxin domain-containing protein [Nocardiopsis ansamitocini]|uniref:(2Fe-2S) ferredoxin domain-containing protein n=1 Tax=Nocardiopsis ansamitocini TaxID=1670832 RepID=UPI002556288C|nr:(2Fe-2S) ferredoxin domain-containing protein [Nocardiopsis ansamitocini]